MNKILILILSLCLAAPAAQAQRRNVKPAKTAIAKERVGGSAGHQLFTTMLPSTAKVMFIDSVVVGKYDFLSRVPLNAESGRLSVKSAAFGKKLMPLTQYETELGDRRFFAVGDTTATALYMQTRVGDGWSQQTCLADISDEEFRWQDFPFLCADGVTLFFSAKGANAIGGRDIFMTSYDSEKNEWLQPQNYGLPFNSSANDYLLAIDDLDTLGWLVTDRRQHADSVCIYTFVPTSVRKDFTQDNLSTAQLERYASIHAIADTWKFGNRQQALRRRDAMLLRAKGKKASTTLAFVLDDNHVITDESQLRSGQARQLLRQWVELNEMVGKSQSDLDHLRDQYARGNRSVANTILQEEKNLRQQLTDLHNVAKQLRRIELQK